MTENRKAIGYVRVSVDSDTKVSPDTQRDAITAYVERKGWDLVDIEVERGKSAGEGKSRPVFDRAIERLAAGEADTLVVFRLDRATRSTVDFADTMRTLNAADAQFVSTSEGFDTTTSMGRAMLQIAVVFAELERASIRERTLAHHRTLRAEGKGTAGIAAFGYRHDDDRRLVVDPVAAAVIERIADAVVDGQALGAIARALNESGALTPPRSKGRWGKGTVRGIVTNPTIAALRHDPDVDALVHAPWEPILDPDRYDAVQHVLGDPARRVASNKRRHLLAGIATCGRCGTKLYTHTRNGTRRYRCMKSDKSPDACQGITVHADRLEAVVISATLDALAGVEIDTTPPSSTPVAELTEALDALATSWARQEITMSEWRSARSVLVEAIEAAEAPRHHSPELAALAAVIDVSAAWDALGLDDRRAVLRDLWSSIEVGPALADKLDVGGRVTMTVSE
jgi:site-specific DNA recombinase